MSNNNLVEKQATNIVEATILRCPLLEPYFEDNNTTPSWDGNVFVYHIAKGKKEHLWGKVPVQIKGTNKSDFSKNKITFSVEVSDLVNYNNDGGVVFYVVYIDNIDHYKIYYVSLLPYDLNKILIESNGQKGKTINLSEYPVHDTDEITNIFMSFLSNRPKQMGYAGRSTPSIEELVKKGLEIESVTFDITGIGINQEKIPHFITTHDFYLYAKPKGLDVFIPVEKLTNTAMSKVINAPVMIHSKIYYQSYSVVYWKGEPIIKIGNSCSLKFIDKAPPLFSYGLKGNLSDRIRDAEFIHSVVTNKSITINGVTATFNINQKDAIYADRILVHCEHLKTIKLMLDQLGVTEELEYSKLTEKDEQNINRLIDAVVFHRHIGLNGINDKVHYGTIHIANLSIMILCRKQEDNLYSVDNFFDLFPIVFSSEKDLVRDPIPTSQFLLMDKYNFVHTSNIDYDTIYDSLTSSPKSELYFDHAILLLLEMLNAYDEQQVKDERLYRTALKFCDWITKNMYNDVPVIMKLNKLQIIKRKRALTPKELVEVAYIKETEKDESVLCGANILLENFDEAQKCFESLPDEVRIEFIKYPICYLWNSKRADS